MSPLPRPERRRPPALDEETSLWRSGQMVIAGLDEAGRGAWAGPVFAAAAILPPLCDSREALHGVRDSKQMTARQRAYWAERIRDLVWHCGVGQASAQEIDLLGILPATRLAMSRALEACGARAEHLLVDALRLPDCAIPQTALIKGDARSLSIAAASVLAKTARDAHMQEQELRYPGYGFSAHKGYGTAAHRAALARLGACPLHRMSFAPLRGFILPGESYS
ncbi:MAG: ribonuclease HII [Bellilinea sp.]